MKTVYELWRKTGVVAGYTRSGPQYDDLVDAMAAAGYADPNDWRWANSDEINRVPTDEARERSSDLSLWVLIPRAAPENDADRITLATKLALEFGQTDGEHHKAWVIDQMLRILTGDRYDDVITEWRAGEDGPETYSWDEGIAP